MGKISSSSVSAEVLAGQAVYSKFTLAFYDWFVLDISNNYFWKCPSRNILNLYKENISNNHLEVGVGTGYFLKNTSLPAGMRLALLDLNKSCLDLTSQKLAAYHPQPYQRNILEPIDLDIPAFDSLGINYVLHCLPGDIHAKGIVFEHLKKFLKPQAVVFGSTILGKGVVLNGGAQKLTDVYNKKGVFTNLGDDIDGLKAVLAKYFSSYHVELIGCVALFQAKA